MANVIEVILKGTDQSMSASLKSATSETQGLTGALGNLKASYVALAAAGAGVARVAQQSVSAAREVQAFSARLGVGVVQLQELKYAAEQSNVGFNQLAVGLQRMTRRIAEAAKGMGEAQKGIKELGLDAKALNQLSPDQQFAKVAEALTAVEAQSDKVRLAFKLFDAEGVGLIQMFDALGPTVAEAREELHSLMGGPLSADEIAKLDEAGRLWGKIGTALALLGSKATIAGAELAGLVEASDDAPPGIPWLDSLIDQLAQAASQAQETQRAVSSAAAPQSVPGGLSQQAATQAQDASQAWKSADLSAPARAQLDLGDKISAMIERLKPLPPILKQVSGEVEETFLSASDEARIMGEIIESDVSPATADLAMRVVDLGYSAQTAWQNMDELTASGVRVAEWAAQVEMDVENLGATMVDFGAEAAMGFGDAMAQMVVDGKNMAESLNTLFKDLVRKIIAHFMKLIALRIFTRIASGGLFSGGGAVMRRAAGGPVYASGGMAIGGYGGGDRIPAMLEAGEVVLNKQTVGAMGMGNLLLANATRGQSIPALAGGGGGGGGSVTINVNARTTFGGRAEGMAIARQVVTLAKEAGAL